MDISSFGFDNNLNIPTPQSPLLSNLLDDSVQANQIASGGNLTIKNLTISGISKMVAPGDDLQDALDFINQAGAGSLLLKAGTYTQKKPLIGYSSVAIKGISPSNTIINFEGSNNLSFTGGTAYTTGTITSISGGVNVTGSGTSWLSKASVGQYLFLGTRHYKIAAVTSDTTLILSEGYTDNVSLPASYRISSPIVNVVISDVSFQNSTGTAVNFTDALQVVLDNVTGISNNKGFSFTNVSRLNILRTLAAASTSNGFEFTNVGQCEWRSVNASANGGHGFVFNNIKTISALLSSVANTSDGFNCTTVVNALLTVEASGNGGQGIEFVSGCTDNEIDGLINSNASDGIKLTASSSRNILRGVYGTNGGYGINIADATDSKNTIDVPIFNSNTSGDYNDLGTNTNIVATITSADKQVFTASGTWTKPASAKLVYVVCVGAGGGGGSGRRGAASTARAGGSGGGGGAVTTAIISASDLTSTVAVTIGVGGSGGTAIGVDSTDGNTGGNGTGSSFGTWVFAGAGGGGNGGSGGTSSAGGGGGAIGNALGSTAGAPAATTNGVAGQGAGGGTSTSNAEYGGASGAFGTIGGPSGGGSSIWGGAGGGAGGDLDAADVYYNGSAGGTTQSYSTGGGGVGGTSADAPTAGTAGSNNSVTGKGYGGQGGGGGGASKAAAAGAGGAGGIPGGGGGGGGASLNGFNSGAGGAGGRGEVRVYSI